MSKAILVIDMPKMCKECPVCESYEIISSIEEYSCMVENTNVDPYDKPKWCPLKQAPDKVEIFVDDWADGYNACLEDILEQ